MDGAGGQLDSICRRLFHQKGIFLAAITDLLSALPFIFHVGCSEYLPIPWVCLGFLFAGAPLPSVGIAIPFYLRRSDGFSKQPLIFNHLQTPSTPNWLEP